ncbi:DinB family protein [Flavobacteriaceae bacterium]|nr:DinB family protein [Flavobacteriaceae bacterium]MDA9026640.1 DinB family protein [Flavobacteriaceae bacterium]
MDWNDTVTQQNRVILSKFLDKFSLEQLNTVPKGFKNSIFWNISHTVVTQQLLTYGLSGQPLLIQGQLVAHYKKGTVTVHKANKKELEEIKSLLLSTLEQTKIDYDNGCFKNFTPYTTSLKVTLSTIEEAIRFNVFHEGIHLGYILAMKNYL